MTSLAIVNKETGEVAHATSWWNDPSKVALLKDTIAQNATDTELALFLAIGERTGLDPFARQIFLVKRYDTNLGRDVMSAQTSIDGFRLIAQRSGRYGGQTPQEWCGSDGVWLSAWLRNEPPAAARCGVYMIGAPQPVYAVATYREYVQTKRGGEPNSMWRRMPANQLSKCAEALALRKAFPAELSGLYTADEMGQASNVEHDVPDARPALAPPRTIDDVARDTACSVDTLHRWWTRDGHDWDADKLIRVHPDNLPKMAAAIAAWVEEQVVQDADAMVSAGDATDEDAPAPQRRRGQPEPEAVDPNDVTEVPATDPSDYEPLPGSRPLEIEEDDVPFHHEEFPGVSL